MQLRPEEAPSYLASRPGVLGEGWREVDTFDDIDTEEFEDEEEEYITLDLGSDMDPKFLQTEGSYQLIGMDTPLPHLKIGNTVLQGQVTPLIGSEIILGLIRNQENPLRPSHPPVHTTSHRITFSPISLSLKENEGPSTSAWAPTSVPQAHAQAQSETERGDGELGMELERPMFLMAPAKYGPNKPPVLPGRKRDRDRAAKRAEARAGVGVGVEGEAQDGMDVDEEREDGEDREQDGEVAQTPGHVDFNGIADDSHASPSPVNVNEDDEPPMSPAPASAGTGTGPGADGTPDWSSWKPRPSGRGFGGPIGRPRTRPQVEVGSLAELLNVDIEKLAANVRVMILPSALHEIEMVVPTTPSTSTTPNAKSINDTPDDSSPPSVSTPGPGPSRSGTGLTPMNKNLDAMHLPTRPLEYTRTQFKKLVAKVHAQVEEPDPESGAGGATSTSGPKPTPKAKTRTRTKTKDSAGGEMDMEVDDYEEERDRDRRKSKSVAGVAGTGKNRKPKPRTGNTEAMFVVRNAGQEVSTPTPTPGPEQASGEES